MKYEIRIRMVSFPPSQSEPPLLHNRFVLAHFLQRQFAAGSTLSV